MKKKYFLFFITSFVFLNSCLEKDKNKSISDNFILVKGGAFINTTSNLYGKNASINDFYISKTEVTQNDWRSVMGNNPSKNKGDNLPVDMVNWYDCIQYCNKRSLKEKLTPYYKIYKDTIDPFNKSQFDTQKWVVNFNPDANGYRLPTEAEWEYAAGGGQLSKNYSYSGSDNINDVAWYWRNSGDTILTGNWNYKLLESNHCRTRPVGIKKPNELGLYDMTGNVREWCEDWFENYEIASGRFRSQRGGGWIGVEMYSKTSDRDHFEANGVGPDQGFRICRNKN